jgi:hypothetical protein
MKMLFQKFRINNIILPFVMISLILLNSSLSFAQTINTQGKGEACFRNVKKICNELSLKVENRITLKVTPRIGFPVQFLLADPKNIESVGAYYQQETQTIWLASNLNKWKATGDIAHEYAHAWQSTNCPKQDPIIREGFSMWCQYKVLVAIGENLIAGSFIHSTDPVSGDGLRLFLNIEKEKNIQGVLEFARNTKEWKGMKSK